MRVLYLMPQPHRAGQLAAYSFLDEELAGLARAGIEPYFVSTRQHHDSEHGAVRVVGVPRATWARRAAVLRFLAGRRHLLSPLFLRDREPALRAGEVELFAADVVRRERIDLVHSHFGWPAGFGGVLVRDATGVPLVASLRGTDVLVDESLGYGRRGDPAYDHSIRTLLRTADLTVYFSEFMRQHCERLGAVASRARVIRKGVDLSQFGPVADRGALKARLGLPQVPMVLTVAGLIPRKGIHHLIEALGGYDGPFVFVVCGEGPERDTLAAQAAAAGIGERVHLVGRIGRDRIGDYFAAADVFTLASIVEAAGNVLFEAMASARPVVCTAAGGPEEYVDDGETGFVVPVGDIAALRDRLGRLLGDPVLADRLGHEGRVRTLARFDYDRMIDDIRGVYREAVGGR